MILLSFQFSSGSEFAFFAIPEPVAVIETVELIREAFRSNFRFAASQGRVFSEDPKRPSRENGVFVPSVT